MIRAEPKATANHSLSTPTAARGSVHRSVETEAMPDHSAVAIANEFLRRRGRVGVTQMWLQKMVYISQGWNLAVNGQPLVAEDVEAWDGGPVFRSIWNHIRDNGFDPSTRMLIGPFGGPPITEELSRSENDVIDHVWRKYNQFTGRELSVMTHRPGTPWTEAYMTSGQNATIPKARIRQHYLELAKAGRAA